MTAYELAVKYYPTLWDNDRLEQLRTAGVLTDDEIAEIVEPEAEPLPSVDYGSL